MMTLIDEFIVSASECKCVNVRFENEFYGNENGRLSLRSQRFFYENDRFHY